MHFVRNRSDCEQVALVVMCCSASTDTTVTGKGKTFDELIEFHAECPDAELTNLHDEEFLMLLPSSILALNISVKLRLKVPQKLQKSMNKAIFRVKLKQYKPK